LIRDQIANEARAAHESVAALSDDGVAGALARAAELVLVRRDRIARANASDLEAAVELDEGLRDRLRLDADALAAQLAQLAELPPLARVEDTWMIADGARVEVRRIPIGAVGANFEARPNVAVDVAGQLLKSLNAAVLRTGGAALGTVTVLVDDVLRPALADAGLPPAAVGLVRTPHHDGAHALVSLPDVLPLVILRGSGETTALLEREAAQHGVRTLAHAEGGGVLYLHRAADLEKARAIVRASLDRLGVCNRLNLLLCDDVSLVPHDALEGFELRDELREWANDPDRIKSVTVRVVSSPDEAARIANAETSGLAAAIVTEDADAARVFLDAYRGTASYWNTTTRLTDGFKLTGSPETGINVDRVPGPRGPVTYRDLYLRQYRVVA
jgi:glutamate-5-semialdehyde dehydrogenase